MLELDDSRLDLGIRFLRALELQDLSSGTTRSRTPSVLNSPMRERRKRVIKKWPIDASVKDRILMLAFKTPLAICSILTLDQHCRPEKPATYQGLPYSTT